MDASKLTVDDVEKIKDQNQLLEIVKSPDFDIRVRIRAANNIEDKNILNYIKSPGISRGFLTS